MSKILIESEEFLLSTTYVTEQFIKKVCEKYNCEYRIKRFSKLSFEDVQWCDVILSIRGKTELSLGLAKIAEKYGKFHIYSIDDDFLSISDTYGRYGVGIFPRRKKEIINILKYTNCVFACNEILGEKFSKLSKVDRWVKTETPVSEEDFKDRDNYKTDTVNIVMYVNDGSTEDFESIVKPALIRLAENYKNQIGLTLLTLKPNIDELIGKIQIEFVDHMLYPEFRKYLAEGKFDIGLAPLSDGEFAQKKYINKFFEYSFAGIPAIYSNVKLYSDVIIDQYNGVLSDNTVEGWVESISALIDSEDLRKYCAQNAQRDIKTKYSMDSIVDSIVEKCPELISFECTKKVRFGDYFKTIIMQRFFVLDECFYFAKKALRKGGIKLLVLRIFRYIGRIISNERAA